MAVREQLIEHCNQFAEERKSHIDAQMQEIRDALNEETKSTVGDKHETGRALLQLEREKVGNQFKEVEDMYEALQKVKDYIPSDIVHLGSVVYTSKFNYFLSISAGETKAEKDTFYAISCASPIGRLLLSKSVGDEVKFRDQIFTIEKIA